MSELLWEEFLPGSLNFRLRLLFRWVHSMYCLHVNIGRQRLLSTSGRTCHGVLLGWTCWCFFYWWKEHNIVSYQLNSLILIHIVQDVTSIPLIPKMTASTASNDLIWSAFIFFKIWRQSQQSNPETIFSLHFWSRKRLNPMKQGASFIYVCIPCLRWTENSIQRNALTNKTTK